MPFNQLAIQDAENFEEYNNRGFTHFNSNNPRRGLAIRDRERSSVANTRRGEVAIPQQDRGYPEEPPPNLPSFYSPMRPLPIGQSTPRQVGYPQVSNPMTLDWDYYQPRAIMGYPEANEPNFDRMLEKARNDTLARGITPFNNIGDRYKIVPDVIGLQDERNSVNAE